MRKSQDLLGMPVISVEEGLKVGTIKGLVVDPHNYQIAALIIEPRGWLKGQKFIPFSQVKSIGDDAVTVANSASAEQGINLPDIVRLYKEKYEIIGCRAITTRGEAFGRVKEYYLDPATGRIIYLELNNGRLNFFKDICLLPVSYVQTIGREIIVCKEDAILHLEKSCGKVGANLSRAFKQSWSQFVNKIKTNKNTEQVKEEENKL